MTNLNKIDESSSLMSFKTEKEFFETQAKVNAMTLQELREYEESKGYRSFGRTCDELYNNLDPEEFKSVEEVKEFVALNSEYFILKEDGDGELTLERALSYNFNRFFLNKDKMFKINKTVYKVFEDVTVLTKEGNADILKGINENTINLYNSNPDFKFTYSKSTEVSSHANVAKDYPPGPYVFCGTYAEGVQTSDRDRTIVQLLWSITDDQYGMRTIQTAMVIEPFKKTLGIWFNCSRTLSWDMKWSSHINVGSWLNIEHSTSGELSSSRVFDTQLVYLTYPSYNFDYHFGGYNGWGRSPSAPVVNLSCGSTNF